MKLNRILALVFISLIFSNLTAQPIYRFIDETTGKWGVRDTEWNIILPPEYDEIQPRPDTIFAAKKEGKMVVFNEKGEVRIPLIYQHILPNLSPFRSQFGYAAVTKDDKVRNSWGMVDAWGKVILPEKFQYVRAISPNLLVGRVDRDTLLQFFNRQGEPVFQKAGKNVLPPRDGFGGNTFCIEGFDRKARFFNLDGTAVFPPDPTYGKWTDGERYIVQKKDEEGVYLQGLTDSEGQFIIPLQSGAIQPALPGQFLVESKTSDHEVLGKGIFDRNGQAIIPSGNYDIQVGENVYLVHDRTQDRTGITTKNGEVILPPEYQFKGTWTPADFVNREYAHPNRYFTAKATDPSGQMLIQKDGTILRCDSAISIQYFSDNYPLLVQLQARSANENRKIKLIDISGKEVLPAEYEVLQYTTDPQVWYGQRAFGQPAGFIRVDAPEQTEFKYNNINRLANHYFYGKLLNSNTGYDLFTPDGKWLLAGEYTVLDSPRREHYETFRRHFPTKKLVARAFRQEMNADEWLAIDATGTEIVMKKEDKPAPVPANDPDLRPLPIEEFAFAESEPSEVVAEKKPSFPGGKDALFHFLTSNLSYPQIAIENDIEGRVVVQFIVEKDGTITNARIAQNIGNGCGQEALRLVQKMPKWEPAEVNGQAVRTGHSLPVIFKLE